ncbi:MAG: hypothetical protein BWY76_01364 [bacterium ADurb.Bin429]|nr:MAG: hypothetical protein BWY76_01364 [bacterium ADurb.Bin429]
MHPRHHAQAVSPDELHFAGGETEADIRHFVAVAAHEDAEGALIKKIRFGIATLQAVVDEGERVHIPRCLDGKDLILRRPDARKLRGGTGAEGDLPLRFQRVQRLLLQRHRGGAGGFEVFQHARQRHAFGAG